MSWLWVVGWEGFYEISSEGIVRSVDRTILTKNGPRSFKGRELRRHRTEKGYYHVALSGDSKPITVNVHVLVAAAFLGPCPSGHEVCHKDGTRTNNVAQNLRYGTRKSNAEDRKIHGTDSNPNAPRGEANTSSILTDAQVKAIRKDGRTLKEIALDHGVHFGTIHCVKARKTWAHIP